MDKHTPEPWRVGTCSASMGVVVSDSPVPEISGSGAVEYYGGHMVAESVSLGNAHRIVACVNACAGLDDPEDELAALLARAKKAEARNTELEAGLSTCIGWIATMGVGPRINEVLQDAREALAGKGE